MTGNAINANSDELSSEQLDAVSGGWLAHWITASPQRSTTEPNWEWDNVMGVVVVCKIRPKCLDRSCSK